MGPLRRTLRPLVDADPAAAAAAAAGAGWFAPGTALSLGALGEGHINGTWLVGAPQGRFVLQRINERVFPEPRVLMAKVAAVVAHLHPRCRMRVPALLPTLSGASHYEDDEAGIWRLWEFVAGTRTLQALANAAQAQAAGGAFGAVQLALADLPDAVPDPIPGFMQLGHYLGLLDATVTECTPDSGAESVLAALPARRDLASLFARRDRLIHGDCKVNNLLFHARRDEVVCVLDLDTVMYGHWAWDFGDLVRSAAADLAPVLAADVAGAGQPEVAVAFSMTRFAAVVRGFVGSGATERDLDALVLAPRYVALMLAVRFLTDHLAGDRYFRVSAPGENLLRARQQLELLQQMERLERAMRETAARA